LKHAIEVLGLHKNYGDVHAVKGLDFYVETGQLFAFLGPNGAGKTTTINMICTLLQQTTGSIHVNGLLVGEDDVLIRQEIGIVFQDHFLDPLLTVYENLITRASFYKGTKDQQKKRVKEAMEIVEISDLASRPYGKLSGGQRRRTDIARALIHKPSILFLDEPTTGLDPQTRKNVWETIRSLQKDLNMTIFLTTHYMEEAAVADYVVVIDHGMIAAKGTPLQLKEAYSTDSLRVHPKDSQLVQSMLEESNVAFSIQGNEIIIELASTMESLSILSKISPHIFSFQVLNGTMDDAFIKITGSEMRP
jgi:multidrug/hemolysin transport system ATP-binding protein